MIPIEKFFAFILRSSSCVKRIYCISNTGIQPRLCRLLRNVFEDGGIDDEAYGGRFGVSGGDHGMV
jgi:hypothetical protein